MNRKTIKRENNNQSGDLKKSELIEIKIPAKSEYIVVVRLAASGICNRLGFSYDDIEDIKVAVGEACINCIQHAYPEMRAKSKIVVKFIITSSCLEIIIRDISKYISKKTAKERLMIKRKKKKGKTGFGIFLMKSLMDEVNFNKDISKGIEVRMKKYLRR